MHERPSIKDVDAVAGVSPSSDVIATTPDVGQLIQGAQDAAWQACCCVTSSTASPLDR